MRMIHLAATLIALSTLAPADDFYVDGLNGSDSNSGASEALAFKTIQRGVVATSSGRGDRILVSGGVYKEAVDIAKSRVSIIGVGTVQIEDAGRGFTLRSPEITLENLRVRHCDTGILWFDGDMTILRRCRLAENDVGLACSGNGTLTVESCEFCCSNREGVATLWTGSRLTFERCTVVGNGIGFRMHLGEVAVRNCIVAFNSSKGLINTYSAHPVLAHNDVFQNGSGSADDYSSVSPGQFDVSEDPQFLNLDAHNHSLRSSSGLINRGSGLDGEPRTIGSGEPGVLFSGGAEATVNFAQWTDGTGARVDGASTQLFLRPDGSIGLTEGTVSAVALSPVVDLGYPTVLTVNAFYSSIEDVLHPSGERRVVDWDPNTSAREFRIRVSTTPFGPLDPSPAWVVVFNNSDNMELETRYFQVEMTLRVDGK